MSMRDLPDQGETEAGPGVGLSGAKEWSEDALAIALSNAGTMVAYGQRCERARGAHVDLNRWGAMTLYIFNQIAHYAAQEVLQSILGRA
jgi:hypothetical protein